MKRGGQQRNQRCMNNNNEMREILIKSKIKKCKKKRPKNLNCYFDATTTTTRWRRSGRFWHSWWGKTNRNCSGSSSWMMKLMMRNASKLMRVWQEEDEERSWVNLYSVYISIVKGRSWSRRRRQHRGASGLSKLRIHSQNMRVNINKMRLCNVQRQLSVFLYPPPPSSLLPLLSSSPSSSSGLCAAH